MPLVEENLISTVNVPVRYLFMPEPAEWSVAIGKVVGWEDRSGHSNLQMLQHMEPWVKVAIADDGFGEESSLRGFSMDPKEVPVGLLPISVTPQNTPNVSSSEFPILTTPRPLFTVSPASSESVAVARDAWAMRNDFFRLEEDDIKSLAVFLGRWGTFESGIFSQTTHHTGDRSVLIPATVWKLQNLLREQGLRSAQEWLRSARLPDWNVEEFPWYTAIRKDISGALFDTITIDKMRDHEHAVCALDGCGVLFAKSTQHKKAYCTEAHSTLARQRKFSRKRKAS